MTVLDTILNTNDTIENEYQYKQYLTEKVTHHQNMLDFFMAKRNLLRDEIEQPINSLSRHLLQSANWEFK